MKNLLLIAIILLTSNCIAQRGSYKSITERNGKIGIGTNNPDELLTVKGKIHTQEVLVDLEGAVAPDYVFESYYTGGSSLNPFYRLMSIDDLATYTSKNNHLPGVPSASEIEKNGLELKKFNLILLEKIEELVIYTLEQQKQIELLKEKIENIEK